MSVNLADKAGIPINRVVDDGEVSCMDNTNHALRVNVVVGGGGGGSGTSAVDEAAFVEGTTSYTPAGGEFKDAGTDLTDGQAGVVKLTAKRAFQVNLRNVAGTEIGTLSNALRVDTVGTTTQPVSAVSLPLPTGASTAAKQAALGTAGSSSTDVLSVQGIASGTPLPMTALAATDTAPATQNITVVDSGSTVTAGQNSQSIITGSATANSTASFSIAGMDNVRLQISGTWTGTLQSEVSIDGGTTWNVTGLHITGTSYNSSSFTANGGGQCNIGAATNYRVRATAAVTGTATIKIVASRNGNAISLLNTPNVKTVATPTLNVGQVSITSSATLILAANTSRIRLIVVQNGTTDVWLGGSGVTTTTGQLLSGTKGNQISVRSTAAVYGIVSSTSQTISYQEETF